MRNIFTLILLFLSIQITFSQSAIKFDDTYLEQAIRDELGIPTDSIYPSDMLNLIILVDESESINNLSGLEHALNLEKFDVSGGFSDISAIANLNSLKYIVIETSSDIKINDLSPLSNKSGLKHLYLGACFDQGVTSMNVISGLTSLDYLNLVGNEISDISALKNLTGLDTLNLAGNNLEEEDLVNLYGLTDLKPPIDLRNNGEGFPDNAISILASKLPNILYINPDSYLVSDSHIYWNSSDKYISISPSLRIKASQVDTLETNHYNLSGYISIQKSVSTNAWVTYLTFSSTTIEFDKRASLANPELSGSGSVYAFGNLISSGSFKYIISNDQFIVEQASVATGDLYGFNFKGGAFGISTLGTEIHYVTQEILLQDLPFPINKIFDYILESSSSDDNFLFTTVGASRIFTYDAQHGTNTLRYALNISLSGTYNFGAFAISEPTLYYNQSTETLSGSFKIKIPGYATGNNLGKSFKDFDLKLPVEIKNKDGELIKSTTLENLDKEIKAWGLSFLEFGMDMQFVEGGLDKLIISLSSSIPLGATGLVISEMTGGVEDFSTDNFKILASVDIETGLSVPVLGSPVKINDFGVKIAPITQFEGSGELEIFGSKTADTKLSYDAEKAMIEMSGNVNIADVLTGKMDASLKSGSFTGTIKGTMQTPSSLPWGFGWAANRKLSAVEAHIDNKTIQAQGQIWKLTLAQKLVFGKETFPYFHYYIGRNYQSLYNIWKGSKTSNFTIPAAVGQALIVVGNDANLFDFSVTSPSGIVFDSNNTEYEQFDESKQTVMLIDYPESGEWSFSTSQSGEITLDLKILNPAPVVTFQQPLELNSLSDSIVFNYYDKNDTLSLEAYIDNDQEGFDGSLVATWGLYEYLSSGIVRYKWNGKLQAGISGQKEVPNGEYFVYVKIDDGNNMPIYQYAPGSIKISNFEFDEVPENVIANQIYDSVLVQWDELVDTSFLTTVHYKSVSDGEDIAVSVVDSSFVYLKNLKYGMEYEIYATYRDPYYLYEGQKSNVVNVIFADSINNNPPYFGANDKDWIFIEGETLQYEIEANDIDNDDLSFEIISGISGITVSGGMISWNPNEEQEGVHELILKLTDGIDNDTLTKNVLAYTQDQLSVNVGFNSSAVYDDTYNLISIYNYWSNSMTELLTLTNKRTAEQINLTCYKTINNTFVSQFEISSVNESDLNVEEGDTIIASYVYDSKTYEDTTVYKPTIDSGTPSYSEIIEKANYKIYPNPNSGLFKIEFFENLTDGTNIEIYDIIGKVVYSRKTRGEKVLDLDLSNLNSGIYLVRVRSGNVDNISKVMIQ